MPLELVKFRPGVDVEQTPTLNSASWSDSGLIRWREGLPEKLGGWSHLNPQMLVGTARGSHAWSDLSGNPYYAVGTEQRLQLFAYGFMYDITPLQASVNVAPAFSTTSGSKSVQITDSSGNAAVGDWLLIPVPVSVGGVILQGFYEVATVIDGSNFTILAASAATTTVTAGGAVPSFTTAVGSSTVTVTLANHGYAAGQLFGIQVATTVGGITLGVGSYSVSSPTTNTFTITGPGAASSVATVSENSGDARLQYLVPSGYATAISLTGYGAGAYGAGPYGGSNGGTITTTVRQWFLDHWGEDLLGSYTGSPLFVWTPPVSPYDGVPPPQTYGIGGPTTPVPVTTPAIAINTTNFPSASSPPQASNGCLVATEEQIAFAWGCDPPGGGTADPCLVRWSDVSDYTDWVATVTNQAGSFRISTGSKIVGMCRGPQFTYLWTDIDFWVIQYIGTPFVFGFNRVAGGCELIASRAAAVYNSAVYWASHDNFYVFDGNTVQPLECTVWDKFFQNINTQQLDKVWAWVNSAFNEIWWFYPSAGSTEVDSYVKYSVTYKCWDYGSLARTTGVDRNVYGAPLACDTNGYIQQHETGYDADGQPMLPFVQSGFFSIANGTFFTVVERLVPDFVMEGGTAPNNRVFVTFLLQDFPTDPIFTYGPYQWSPTGPPYNVVRGRGRVAAIRISSSDLGVFWRLGAVRYSGSAGGRR